MTENNDPLSRGSTTVMHTLPASWFAWSPTGTPPVGAPIRCRVAGVPAVGAVVDAVAIGSEVLLTIEVPA